MTNLFGDDLDRWVAAGLLEEKAASSIRAYEADRSETGGPLSVAAEGLAYFGASLVAAGLIIGLSLVGDDWSTLVKVALVAGTAAALGIAGWRLSREEAAPLVRLTDVLLGGAILMAGWAAAIIADEGLGADRAAIGFAAGLMVVLLGGTLWRVRRRPIPLTVFSIGAAVGLLALLEMVVDIDWLSGFVLWAFSAALLMAGWRKRVEPPTTAIVLGVVGVGLGAQLVASDAEVVGAILGLATMLSLLAVAVGEGSVLLLILGALGTFVFAPQVVFAILGESALGPVALAGLGIALVIVAIATVRTVERSAEV